MFKSYGHKKVSILDGGLKKWKLDKLPIEKGNPKIISPTFYKANLTREGAKLILPYVKSIIEDITNKGGSIKITLKDVDLDLIVN